MSEKRYFYVGDLSAGSVVELEGQEFHHMAVVMRERVGDNVLLFNGDGCFYDGVITAINKKSANIAIKSQQPSTAEPSLELHVYQALAKGDKLSLIAQKIAELGATGLYPYDSKFCDVKSNTTRIDRLDAISVSASKQCGRATVMKVNDIHNILWVAKNLSAYDSFFVAYENQTGKTLADAVCKLKNSAEHRLKIGIMIGPEGGFAPEEIQLLQDSGAKIVTLGKRILRTETAAIACTALIMQLLDK